MAWTSPRTWVAGETVTAALLNTHLRDNMLDLGGTAAAWTAFTPTWTANGSTITLNANSFFRYKPRGKTIEAEFSLAASSGATAGTDWQITLPVAPRSNSVVTPLGQGSCTSNNAGWHTGDGHLVGAIMKLFRPATSTYMSGIVAAGDQWYGTLLYEAA